MSSHSKYIVTGFNVAFNSLEDAKWNVKLAFTRSEAKIFLADHEKIVHYIGDKLHSETPINVDEVGNITFGKTRII